MSAVENVFVGTDAPLRQVADEWLDPLLALEPIPDGLDSQEEIGLRCQALDADGWLMILVRRNGYAEVNPEPDDVQAFDAYPTEIAIRYRAEDELAQQRQARLVFDRLVATRPDVPMLLVHDLDILVAAHLPAAGTQYFPDNVTVDAPDQDQWRPWGHG
ncbi:hypothetical protein GCM10009789_39400 [Kribbella sancticallisti]|uniref:Uncharacterized protein n=1 Tax=Kribbella sancticallisti TaxID=460087 RepID=A0ABN2DQY9_9ACTN